MVAGGTNGGCACPYVKTASGGVHVTVVTRRFRSEPVVSAKAITGAAHGRKLGSTDPRRDRCMGLVFHRATIQEIPFVAPLLDRVPCCLGELEVWSAYDGNLFHGSALSHDQFQVYFCILASGARIIWASWHNSIFDKTIPSSLREVQAIVGSLFQIA